MNHLWDLCDCAACSEIGFEPLVGGTPSQNPEKFKRDQRTTSHVWHTPKSAAREVGLGGQEIREIK